MKPVFALTLHGDKMIGGMPLDVTERFAGWRHSIQRIGGFWQASASYNLAEGDMYEMRDLFINGLGRRITAEIGGSICWEGFLGEMDMVLEGQRWTRSLLDCANAVKIAYTRTSANLFTVNPSVEDNPWPAEGTHTTRNEQSTTWHSLGDYSQWCITRAADNDEGMQVGIDDAGDLPITIEAEISYQVKVSVNIVTGTWVLKVKETGTDATIAKAKSAGTGEQIICAEITEDNTYTEVRVILIEKTAGTAGEIYADNARFQYTPTKGETTWYSDSAAIATYGRIEDIIMEEVLTDNQAGGRAQWHLNRRAWPRTLPSKRMTVSAAGGNSLRLRFYGYVFTLNWQHIVTTGGEAQADVHIASLIGEGQSEFTTAGTMVENTMTVMVDSTYPTRLWDKIKKIIEAGDDDGDEWEGGVYGGLEFHYHPMTTTTQYHFAGGRFLAANYEEVPPWKVRPALTMLDDMPVGPGEITGRLADDPRIVLLEGIEYVWPERVIISPIEIGFQAR